MWWQIAGTAGTLGIAIMLTILYIDGERAKQASNQMRYKSTGSKKDEK